MLLVAILCVFLILFTLIFLRSRLLIATIQGYSMYPTLICGDRILALRKYPIRSLHKGQIVICDLNTLGPYLSSQQTPRPPANDDHQGTGNVEDDQSQNQIPQHIHYIVKRLIGLPGDTIVIPIAELQERVRAFAESRCDEQGNLTWHIPPGYCFIRGDGPYSVDSVLFGPIPLHLISGISLVRLQHRNDAPPEEHANWGLD